MGDVATSVLRIDDSLAAKSRTGHGGIQPVHLLGDPDRPYIVYLISSGTLHGFYYDVGRKADLVSIARDHGAAELDAATARRQTLVLAASDIGRMGRLLIMTVSTA